MRSRKSRPRQRQLQSTAAHVQQQIGARLIQIVEQSAHAAVRVDAVAKDVDARATTRRST